MKIITIPCAFDNYAYLIICENTHQAGVVDPAEFYPVWNELENQGVALSAILCTHNHMDHTGGNENIGKGGTIIVAHDNVRKRLEKGQLCC